METSNRTGSRLASGIASFFRAIGQFFSEFGTAFVRGDLFVKLSVLWWGAGYARRRQYVKCRRCGRKETVEYRMQDGKAPDSGTTSAV